MRRRWFTVAGLSLWLAGVALVPHVLAAEPAAEPAASPPPAERTIEADDEYYELLKLFVDTLDQVERNYVKDVSRRELVDAAIQGMLSKLDQYSDYIKPDQVERFRTEVEAEFGGIGIQIMLDGGQLTVSSPLVGSPAHKAGVLSGDRIVKIEGEDTKGLSIDEAVRKLKGPIGTQVTITVLHPHNNERQTLTLRRETIRVETVLGERRHEDGSWDYLYDHEQKIGYVRLTAFSRHTTEELRAALDRLKKEGMRALVIDLRFNPGGLLSSAIEVSDLFVASGKIVSTAGRNTPERTWEAKRRGTYEDFPMAVLVNHYSASASEIVSACLQDHQRAVVVGERTWGKGSVQNIVELEGGRSALKLTTAGYLRPNGKNIHKFDGAADSDDWGVSPDDGLRVELSGAEVAELLTHQREQFLLKQPGQATADRPSYTDRQLAKALELLKQKVAPPAPPEPAAEQVAEPEKEAVKAAAIQGAAPGSAGK